MLILILAAFCADPEPPSPFKVLAQATYPWAHQIGKKDVAIRNAAELAMHSIYSAEGKDKGGTNEKLQKYAEAGIAKALGVKEVDWDKQMLLVVSAGMQKASGYRLRITSIRQSGRVLKVSYTLTAPKGPAPCAITLPSTVVLVPRFAGKIEFVGTND
jgi:hypothetical protein